MQHQKTTVNNLIAYDYEKISIDTRRSSRNGTLCKRTATRQYSGRGSFHNRQDGSRTRTHECAAQQHHASQPRLSRRYQQLSRLKRQGMEVSQQGVAPHDERQPVETLPRSLLLLSAYKLARQRLRTQHLHQVSRKSGCRTRVVQAL